MKGLIIGVWLILGLTACRQAPEAPPEIHYGHASPVEVPVYTVAIHPLYSPGRLFEMFSPVLEYLNKHLKGKAKLKLEASQNYTVYDEKIRAQEPDFLVPNPFQTLIALRHKYHVIGKVADDSNFRGIILVRKSDAIHKVSDLKGGVIAAPGPTALAATMMPKYFLATHGLDVNKDVRYYYTGSQESTIMALYLQKAQAATTWPVPWHLMQKTRPKVAAALRVAWQTETLPSISVMAHERVPQAVAHAVIKALVEMERHQTGKRLLQASTFGTFDYANDQAYAPVAEFIHAYGELVEPVEVR